jgi:hypothetical protein
MSLCLITEQSSQFQALAEHYGRQRKPAMQAPALKSHNEVAIFLAY